MSTGETITKLQPLPFGGWVTFKDPRLLWEEHWFALVFEIIAGGIIITILRHARKSRADFYQILAAVVCMVVFEILPILPRPGYQLWWYHEGMVNILKQRVPSYIVTSFAIVHYAAHRLTIDCNLPAMSKSFLTAIAAILLYFPALWMSPHLLFNFVHFDDPVFQYKILNVPCIQVLIVFLQFFHSSQLFHENFKEIESKSEINSMICSLQSGFVGGLYTLIEQYLLYLLVTLILKSHTGLTIVVAVGILGYLLRDELGQLHISKGLLAPFQRRAFWGVVAGLFFLTLLPLTLEISSLKSNSRRLEMGPCDINHEVSNTSPLEVPRRRFLCPRDTDRVPFDLHCVSQEKLSQAVKSNAPVYTICGKGFEEPSIISRNIAIYSIFCLAASYVIMRLRRDQLQAQ